jgi:hypothetical protein
MGNSDYSSVCFEELLAHFGFIALQRGYCFIRAIFHDFTFVLVNLLGRFFCIADFILKE